MSYDIPAGTVTKDKTRGTWFWRLTVTRGPHAGQYRRRGVATKTSAQAALDVHRQDLLERGPIAFDDLTFGGFFSAWLEARELVGLRESTIASYRHQGAKLKGHGWLWDYPLGDVTAQHLDKLYADELREGGRGGRALAPKTVRNLHATVSKALGDAARKGLIRSNPATKADPPSAEAAAPAAGPVRTSHDSCTQPKTTNSVSCSDSWRSPDAGEVKHSSCAGPTSSSTPGRSRLPGR